MTDHDRGQIDTSAAEVYDGFFVPASAGSLNPSRTHPRSDLSGTGPNIPGFISQEKLVSLGLWTGFGVTFTMKLTACGEEYTESSMSGGTGTVPADIPRP